MKKKVKKFAKALGSIFRLQKDEEAQFRLNNGLKMTLIPMFSLILTIVLFYILLEMDLIFFEANGFSGAKLYKETYYDFIFTKLTWIIPCILVFFVIVFIMGIYISELLLRPFKVIGDYCEKKVTDSDASYDPDFFSDLKLLTSFSEWFFNVMENSQMNKEFKPHIVPSKFTKIHGPVFETGFFIQYSLFILTTSICAALAIKVVAIDLYTQVMNLSYNVLELKPEIQYFFKHQNRLFENTLYIVLLFHVFAYIILAAHLYKKVSVPAFAFFSTMRSYAKGSRNSRVHLLGHSYIRKHSRKFNKYLDKHTCEFHLKEK